MIDKRTLIALGWVALVMIATVGLVYLFQRSLIYLPSQAVPDPPPDGVEAVTYETNDGLSLDAWFLSPDSPNGSIIVFNGNAGNRSGRLPLSRALAGAGYAVLLTDYRGYGGNPGAPSEEGLAEDARAAHAYMNGRVGSHLLFYFGESLGAGVAIGLAIENTPAVLILRSPFVSLPDVASVHYWYLPASLLLKDRYPNLERIDELDIPVLVIAGNDDEIVPIGQSQQLFESASEPKELLVIDGAGHNDPALLDGDEMIEGIVEFLSRVDP